MSVRRHSSGEGTTWARLDVEQASLARAVGWSCRRDGHLWPGETLHRHTTDRRCLLCGAPDMPLVFEGDGA